MSGSCRIRGYRGAPSRRSTPPLLPLKPPTATIPEKRVPIRNDARDVLKRYESNEDLLNTFEDVQNNGLQVYAYNLIGVSRPEAARAMPTRL